MPEWRAVHSTEGRAEAEVVAVPREQTEDTSLSLRTKGLLVYLMSFEDDEVDLTTVHEVSREGRDVLRTMINELRTAGYLFSFRRTGADGRFSYEHVLSEVPLVENPTPPEQRNVRRTPLRQPSPRGWVCPVCGGIAPANNRVGTLTYFVQRGRYVKIGKTRALSRRLATLRKPAPGVIVPSDFDPRSHLVLLGTSRIEEHVFHERFAPWHAAGEWFDPTPEMWDRLSQCFEMA